MKISALRLMVVIFSGMSAYACSEELQISYPPGFSEFYSDFRSTIVSGRGDATLRFTCFPFQSTETGETVEAATRNISQKDFEKFKLGQYYLNDLAGLISSSIVDGLPTKRLYMNSGDFIIRNPDPSRPQKLNENSRNLFVVKLDSVVISNLTFARHGDKWCWSGAEISEPISLKIKRK